MRVGMFDSGIGGVTVLKEFINKHPNNEYYYYGDTLNVPYGNKTKEELLSLCKPIINYLDSRNVDIIIIACGTVSSNVYNDICKLTNTPIYTVFTYLPKEIKDLENTCVLATNATINSHIFKNINNNIIEIASPGLVPLIENNKDVTDELLKLLDKDYDNIILGCTHYPHIEAQISKLQPKANIINMGTILANNIALTESIQSINLYFTKDNDLNIQKSLDYINKK